jgi:pimeloyl-ACP methyl ester carboxylesterase
MTKRHEASDRADTFVPHKFEERLVDLGEIRMNYARVGNPSKPALLLIPGQTESWWGYEAALALLADDFEAFAVDLRGQGRSTWTPGRYTLDNMGNDLVRFIDLVIKRPTIVSGLSSGGVLSAWMSAYAKPGQVRAALYEDPPLFSSEVNTSTGASIRQSIGPVFALFNKYLGDQWSIGDYAGMRANAAKELPPSIAFLLSDNGPFISGGGPPQNMKEYDPEWGRAFWTGAVAASCDHERMLSHVKVPVLLTHHFRITDEQTGGVRGAMSDIQAKRVLELVAAAGQQIDYISLPMMGHVMHQQDPARFVKILTEWVAKLK